MYFSLLRGDRILVSLVVGPGEDRLREPFTEGRIVAELLIEFGLVGEQVEHGSSKRAVVLYSDRTVCPGPFLR